MQSANYNDHRLLDVDLRQSELFRQSVQQALWQLAPLIKNNEVKIDPKSLYRAREERKTMKKLVNKSVTLASSNGPIKQNIHSLVQIDIEDFRSKPLPAAERLRLFME